MCIRDRINVLLDFVFVAGFGMGVLGAALATDIAESSSAFLCIFYIYRKVPLLQLTPKEMHMDRDLLRLTLENGSVTALQQCCQPIGKLLIQGMINPLGVSTIAAFNAVNRIDDFAFTPEQSISSGMMTFVAQNRGAGKKDRVRQGFRKGLMVEAGYWVIICAVILLFKKPIMQLFVSEGDVGTVSYTHLTGELEKILAGQGYSDTSSWSRGQSWILYGFALSYRYTKDPAYLDIAKKSAHYFISNIALTDHIPLCDFRQPEYPKYLDTSAGLCAACGLMEIAEHVSENEKQMYLKHAEQIVKNTAENYCCWDPEKDSIVQQCKTDYHSTKELQTDLILSLIHIFTITAAFTGLPFRCFWQTDTGLSCQNITGSG